MSYHSQWGQDSVVHQKFFPRRKWGVFVDVGAHDGVDINNTLFFEELGWTGLCIEPNPEVFARLEKNRRCPCIQGCAYSRSGTLEFQVNRGYTEALSGIRECYDPRHLDRIEREKRERGGESTVISVPAYTLQELCDRFQIRQIDYLSIDTEGSELEVLQGIDFSRMVIKVIGVEENYPDRSEELKKYLFDRGFEIHQKVGGDLILVNTEWYKTTFGE